MRPKKSATSYTQDSFDVLFFKEPNIELVASTFAEKEQCTLLEVAFQVPLQRQLILRLDPTKDLKSGSYGTVSFFRLSQKTPVYLVVKKVKESTNEALVIDTLNNNAELLQCGTIRSRHFSIECVSNQTTYNYLFLEYMDTDLGSYCDKQKPSLPLDQIGKVVSQVYDAAHCLLKYSQDTLVFLDIKPENVLVKTTPTGEIGLVALGDLGSCVPILQQEYSVSYRYYPYGEEKKLYNQKYHDNLHLGPRNVLAPSRVRAIRFFLGRLALALMHLSPSEQDLQDPNKLQSLQVVIDTQLNKPKLKNLLFYEDGQFGQNLIQEPKKLSTQRSLGLRLKSSK